MCECVREVLLIIFRGVCLKHWLSNTHITQTQQQQTVKKNKILKKSTTQQNRCLVSPKTQPHLYVIISGWRVHLSHTHQSISIDVLLLLLIVCCCVRSCVVLMFTCRFVNVFVCVIYILCSNIVISELLSSLLIYHLLSFSINHRTTMHKVIGVKSSPFAVCDIGACKMFICSLFSYFLCIFVFSASAI